MKRTLFFIFAFVSLSAFSQSTWTKGNAVWHYQLFNVAETGYVKLWENGDTTLLGKQCAKLKAERHSFMLTGPNGGYFESVTDYIGGAVYASNDTVYYWDIDHFSVLYDFSAQVADQWLLQTGGTPAFSCNDTSVCEVESVGTVNLGGQNYPELTLNTTPGGAFQMVGKANARFGASQGYLLPFPTSCDSSIIVEWDQLSFICFEDDSLYYNPGNLACEMHLGLDESVKSSVSVFPNPSQGKIELVSEVPLKQVLVINVVGATLKELNPNVTLAEIDLSELPGGTYYLNVEDADGHRIVKQVQILGGN